MTSVCIVEPLCQGGGAGSNKKTLLLFEPTNDINVSILDGLEYGSILDWTQKTHLQILNILFYLGLVGSTGVFADLIWRGDVGQQFNLLFKMSSFDQTMMDQQSAATPMNRQ